jgi:hypothetical protein
MTRYLEVQKHVGGGRTITQRYPARAVAWAARPEWDAPVCQCGYIRCQRTGPCAPPPPPPEGWSKPPTMDAEQYRHISGATVWLIHGQKLWRWTAPGEPACHDERRLPTRNEAMAAALASVQPAEPTLRAGWVIRGTFMGEPDYWFGDFNVCSSAGDGDWSICSECGFELAQRDTLEAAMLRAEALARGEP